MKDSIQAYHRLAVEAAQAAGRVIMSNLQGKVKVAYKGKFNLVTETDHLSEKTIVRLIRQAYPHHRIVAEEGHGKTGNEEIEWFVDPLDGTTNFAHGFPSFCVSIGLQIRREMALGVVYDPFHEELFAAQKGRGASLNGRPIAVSRTRKLKESLVVTGFTWRSMPKNLRHFSNFSLRVQGIRRTGSAALDLCYVAMGRFDGYWELMLSPWDVAAGGLVVLEAGGRLTDFSGRPFSIYSQEILASNGSIHREMMAVLTRKRRA